MIFSKIKILNIEVYIIGTPQIVKAVYLNPDCERVNKIKLLANYNSVGEVKSAVQYISKYSAGIFSKLPKLDFSNYTEKQLLIYNALLNVAFGTTISYAELAGRTGIKGASRFAGTTMKKNNFPILIPCHRVIKADGSYGQFNAGKEVKINLLDFERENNFIILK